MRGKIFDDLMMFIGYFLPIFIIILAAIIFILTSIFKYYHINNPAQYAISIQNQNNQNNQNYTSTINSTIMVDIYYQNGYSIYYLPSFIENLSNWSIFYNITNTYSGVNSGNNLLAIAPSFIININSTTFNVNSLDNVQLESTIILSNNTNEGNNVEYTYNGNTYECKIIGNSNIEYQAGSFVYFCILCEQLNGQNMQNYYLNESEYLSITSAIYLLGNSYPNTQYYNRTVNNVEIVNGTYLVITLSNNGGYSMEDFQNILIKIGPPLSNYIQKSPYVGDNVVFLVNYGGKYYALPSWYAGESNGNYYFFINLLNIPSLYNNNFGCSFLPIFVGFSNENLLPYLNGTIGGAPEALDPNNPSSAVMYDNGLNVFPIYVNFYPYPGQENTYEIEDSQSCGNSNGFSVCYQNNYGLLQQNNVLPPYNNVTIYLNGTGVSMSIVMNGPLEGLVMDDGTWQGSYALITSTVLQNTFALSQSSNGLGLQTFAYFSGIPWEDSPSTVINPKVADAVVLSYVTNNQFGAYTVEDYNTDDLISNWICSPLEGCQPTGNRNIGIDVGGDTYLPLNFPIFMYEYGWTYSPSQLTPSCFPIQLYSPAPAAGPGVSSGYYVGILQYNNTPLIYNIGFSIFKSQIIIHALGFFLTTQYKNNPNAGCCYVFGVPVGCSGYYDYYYSGSGWSLGLAGWNANYYFLEDITGNIYGKNGGTKYFDFILPDQQKNKNYYQYGVFWLYNWFQSGGNTMNIYFLMNGNIFNYSLASGQDVVDGAYAIPPNPPASTINGEPIFVQSYINAYNTAFNQQNRNYQKALYNYQPFTYGDVNSNFIPGTFGSGEQYNDVSNPSNNINIGYLVDDANYYNGNPYLFISAGSGGGSGYMYLDWVIVTYGVPYVVNVS